MADSPTQIPALEMVAKRLHDLGIEYEEISFAVRSNITIRYRGSTRCIFCRHHPNLFFRAAWKTPGQDGRKAKAHRFFCRNFAACDARRFQNAVQTEV